MTDFAARFAALKQVLDDPDARFIGAGMRDELLALVGDLPDTAAEAWLFRELAVLEGKRDELACLDHADRALAAHAASDALPADRLYFMHLVCGDVGTIFSGGPRTKMHLDHALALHGAVSRPIEEAFAIRLNQGVHSWSNDSARRGLDWFEPLLTDGEGFYGAESPELSHLLWLMSRSEEALGNMPAALTYGTRSLDLVDRVADPERKVTAMLTHANLLHRAGQEHEARQLLAEAHEFAADHCSAATQEFLREQTQLLFPSASPQSLIGRVRRILSRGR